MVVISPTGRVVVPSTGTDVSTINWNEMIYTTYWKLFMISRNHATNQLLNYQAMELILGLGESLKFYIWTFATKTFEYSKLQYSPHKHQVLSYLISL